MRQRPAERLHALSAVSLVLCVAAGVAYLGSLSCDMVPRGGELPVLSSHPVLMWWSLFFGLLCIECRVVRTLRTGWADEWRRNGQCARCGYDLRATPVWCPACGAERSTTKESA